MYKLSLKLNVPMNYFFDESVIKEDSTIQNFKILSNKLLADRDYESFKHLYELEIEKKQKLPLSDQLYLSWIVIIQLFIIQSQNMIMHLLLVVPSGVPNPHIGSPKQPDSIVIG